MRVVFIPLLQDNYGYLLIDEATQEAAVVDPAEVEPVLAAVRNEGVRLRTILNTHHHWDHTGGNQGLIEAVPGLQVIGSAEDSAKIPGITRPVADGDSVAVGRIQGQVLFVPCHTRGHVAYLFGRFLFCGDTLFAGGCGRFFEGSARDMDRALRGVFGALPDDTLVYCGHEYTQKNLEFARTLEPTNAALAVKSEAVRALRAKGLPTIPTTLGEERSYNPFLRTSAPELVASVKRAIPELDPGDPVAVLAGVRALKDKF